MDEFTLEKAKEYLKNELKFEPEYAETYGPFDFASGKACRLTVKNGETEDTYFVFDDGQVRKEPAKK